MGLIENITEHLIGMLHSQPYVKAKCLSSRFNVPHFLCTYISSVNLFFQVLRTPCWIWKEKCCFTTEI